MVSRPCRWPYPVLVPCSNQSHEGSMVHAGDIPDPKVCGANITRGTAATSPRSFVRNPSLPSLTRLPIVTPASCRRNDSLWFDKDYFVTSVKNTTSIGAPWSWPAIALDFVVNSGPEG